MRWVRRSRFALGAVVPIAGWILLAAAPASASISGPCTAMIGGTNVADLSTSPTATPVKVKKNGRVLVTMQSARQMTHLKITLNFAGTSWTVKDKDISSNSWAESVAVDDYAKYGVGLYLVEGTGTGTGFSCTGDGLVEVEGSPFATVAGWVAIGLTVLGLGGVAVATLGARRGTRGLVGAEVLGGIAGLLGGIGVGVLLQQFSVLYPTRSVAVTEVVIGILIGLTAPLLARLLGGRAGADTPGSAQAGPSA